MKPDLSRVTFVAVKEGGWSTKYTVKDAKGSEWGATLGKEAQPETAANRLLWAIGYHTEISHLAPELEIQGKGTCKYFFFQAEDGIRDKLVTGVQTCALPILRVPIPGLLIGRRQRLQLPVVV